LDADTTRNESQWRIPPHQSKTIVTIGLDLSHNGSFRGFLHIVTDHDTFLVPIEFILTNVGIHPVVDEIDFGTFFSPTDERNRDIALMNAYSNEYVLVYDSTVKAEGISNQVPSQKRTSAKHGQVEFKRITLAPGESKNAARVTFYASEQGLHTGSLIFHTNDTSQPVLSVPYRARVYHGTLDYRLNSTAFYEKADTYHEIVLMNSFQTPLLFQSAQLFDKRFQIKDFKKGFVLPTNGKSHVLTIQFTADESVTQRKTNLILDTNITRLFVPLYVFDGRLDYQAIDQVNKNEDESIALKSHVTLQLGKVANNQSHFAYFVIYNPNPIPIKILDWQVSMKGKDRISSSFIKVYQNNDTLATLLRYNLSSSSESINSKQQNSSRNDSFIFALFPKQKVVMRVQLDTDYDSSSTSDVSAGTISFITPYKNLTIDVHYQPRNATLTFPSLLTFENSFPGRSMKRSLHVTSTFDQVVTISNIQINDTRFTFTSIPDVVIQPKQRTKIGTISLSINEDDPASSFMSAESGGSDGKGFKGGSANANSHEFSNYRLRHQMFQDLVDKGENNIFATATIDVDPKDGAAGLRRYVVPISCNITIPELTSERQLQFKLTPINTFAQRFVKLKNPSDKPISVQLILGNDALAKFLNRRDKDKAKKNGEAQPKLSVSSNQGYTDFQLHKEGRHTGVIQPNRHLELGPIVFVAQRRLSEAVLYIRNNMTLYDMIQLRGTGGDGSIGFEDEGVEVISLDFNIPEASIMQATSLEAQQSPDYQPSFTKTFTLTNKGNMPLVVHDSSVNGYGCRAYGVELHNCGSMELQPGQTANYPITFQPDFTSSLVELNIRFATSQGTVLFPLKLTLPYAVLPSLYKSTRPAYTHIERAIRLAVASFVLLLALVLVVRAFKDMKPFMGFLSSVSSSTAQTNARRKDSIASTSKESVMDQVPSLSAKERMSKSSSHGDLSNKEFIAPAKEKTEKSQTVEQQMEEGKASKATKQTETKRIKVKKNANQPIDKNISPFSLPQVETKQKKKKNEKATTPTFVPPEDENLPLPSHMVKQKKKKEKTEPTKPVVKQTEKASPSSSPIKRKKSAEFIEKKSPIEDEEPKLLKKSLKYNERSNSPKVTPTTAAQPLQQPVEFTTESSDVDLINNYNNANKYVRVKKEKARQQHNNSPESASGRERSSSDPALYNKSNDSSAQHSQEDDIDQQSLAPDDDNISTASSVESSDGSTMNYNNMIGMITRNHMMQMQPVESPHSPALGSDLPESTSNSDISDSYWFGERRNDDHLPPLLSHHAPNNFAAPPTATLFGFGGANSTPSLFNPYQTYNHRYQEDPYSMFGKLVSALQPTASHSSYSLFDTPPSSISTATTDMNGFPSQFSVPTYAVGDPTSHLPQPTTPPSLSVRPPIDNNMLFSNESFFSSSPSRFSMSPHDENGIFAQQQRENPKEVSSSLWFNSSGTKPKMTPLMNDLLGSYRQQHEQNEEEEEEEPNPLWNE
jgi:hypothetical protein